MWSETIGGQPQLGDVKLPHFSQKPSLFQRHNSPSAVKLTFSSNLGTAWVSGNGKRIPWVDFHFTFPLASVPLQGTMLLAHKEVARLLVGGKTEVLKQLLLITHSEHENKFFKSWAKTDREECSKMIDVILQLRHFKWLGFCKDTIYERYFIWTIWIYKKHGEKYLLTSEPAVQRSILLYARWLLNCASFRYDGTVPIHS